MQDRNQGRQVNEFSSLKAAWHIERIADLRAGKDIVPTHVQIVLSDLCNQNCHFCSYRMDGGFSTQNFADEHGNKNPNRRIGVVKALEILDDCAAAGVEAIEFTGGGEPTVHPHCFEIIEHAQILGMQTGLVTNGVKLRPCAAVERLTWLRISVDAGTADTYERMRESKAWPQAMKALDYAGTLKGPLVGMGYVITRDNHDEIVAACLMAREKGIAYVRLSAMFSADGAKYYDGLIGDIAWQRGTAKALETDTFKVADFFGNRIADLEQHAPDYKFCGEQQFVAYIGGDLRVYTCCTNAYTDKGRVGDLRNMRFAEWIKTRRQMAFDARGCHDCQFNSTNRNINYLLDPSPDHVGFV
jgi:MoaA/NifB/PqqE/SkfB family radical SAM enzyme